MTNARAARQNRRAAHRLQEIDARLANLDAHTFAGRLQAPSQPADDGAPRPWTRRTPRRDEPSTDTRWTPTPVPTDDPDEAHRITVTNMATAIAMTTHEDNIWPGTYRGSKDKRRAARRVARNSRKANRRG